MNNEARALTLYGKMLVFSRLQLHTTDIDSVIAQVREMHMGGRMIPVVIELPDELSVEGFELSALVDALWDCGVGVIGVMDGALNAQADALKLARFPSDGSRIERLSAEDRRPAALSESAVSVSATTSEQPEGGTQDDLPGIVNSSLVHEQMVRAGQAVQYLGGDLIVTGSVNRGGEVITDGNLHVYGKGEGRLVAGATGDERARIFCQSFDPTLVSVAGMYCLKDDMPAEMIGQAVQVSYSKDSGLIFTLMKQ